MLWQRKKGKYEQDSKTTTKWESGKKAKLVSTRNTML